MPRSISKTQKELSPDKKLNSIIENRTSGAAEIEIRIIRLFVEIINSGQRDSPRYLRKAINKIKKRFSAMANILNLADFTVKLLRKKDLEYLSESLNGYRRNIEHNRRQTIIRAAYKIKSYGSIFTLSGSSLIIKAILEGKNLGWRGEVRIVESRPKNEGVGLAKKTAGSGIRTVLGVDAAMPDMIKNSGAVFLGADAVTQTYFVNKIGSDIAVEYAAKFRKPVYVVADGSKFIPNNIYKFIPDNNPDSEIIPRRMKNLEIMNNYFEKVIPRGKVHFIRADRIISAGDIKNLLKRRT
ncbi:MAG: hypothetical protein JSW64_08625 [Candidatus Zixiibacteriota bacterium]|nr:MAG: hypothetical protein JSW64_08625 [candidate division Zixibacteria bacterium]